MLAKTGIKLDCFSQVELALDVEVALPYFVQRWSRFIVRSHHVLPNKEEFPLMKHIRWLIEGGFMSQEAIIDKVLGNVLVSKGYK